MNNNATLCEAMGHLDPSTLDYNEWLAVGMALHEEGCPCEMWEEWSSKDAARYRPGECQAKWSTFSHGSASPVRGGTIIKMAKERGWNSSGHPLDWNDTIQEGPQTSVTRSGSPEQELIKYIETLFEQDEFVGYVTQSYSLNGRYAPTKGNYSLTAGEIIERLVQHHDIEKALGAYDEKAGCWIHFNPLDGQGVKNDNVAAYRYALVESDSATLEEQEYLIHTRTT